MSFLIDTNVISEPLKNTPNQNVCDWLSSTPPEMQFLSVLTIGEIRKGLERHAGKRKSDLTIWLERDLYEWFENRILSIDFQVAERWGYIVANIKQPLPVVDTLLAATALTHNLTIVTRNTRDFNIPGLEVVNPWE